VGQCATGKPASLSRIRIDNAARERDRWQSLAAPLVPVQFSPPLDVLKWSRWVGEESNHLEKVVARHLTDAWKN